jgi:SAM-dependent methyltransferase
VKSAPAPEHYSYTHYADPTTAQTFDARRFGGPVGELVAEAQARVLIEFIGLGTHATRATYPSGPTHPSILDVGTGTGRAAVLLARNGARVTGVDASDAMLAVARRRAADERVDATFRTGDAHALEFPDRTFDVAVSLRVLMHTPDWRRCIDELCRVASGLVVIDYPSAFSFAAVESIWRKLAHTVGSRTEPYRVFRPRAVEDALARNGFRVRSVHRQFVLPIVLHKAIGSPRFTLATEKALGRMGLLRLLGSPVTLVAERCASS